MHEWSIAKALLQQAERVSAEAGHMRLVEIRVQVGPLSGVEASLLESAFDQLVCELSMAPIGLVVEPMPLVVRCRDCQVESERLDFDFVCQACHGRAVQVIHGDQIMLVSITAEDRDRPSPDLVTLQEGVLP